MASYYLKLYGITLIAFLAIDMVWLGFIARGLYKEHLGYLLSDQPNWLAAIIFYLLFIVGLLVFVLLPGLQAQSWGKLLGLAVLYGLITYGTYDLTNLATVKNWPLVVTVVDMSWGAILSASVAAIGFLAGRYLQRS